MSKATRRLPDALAALGLLATVAGLLPFGDKLSAGVNIAISLCEAAQTAKFNQSAYEDLSSRCTSLLLAVATCMRTADPKKRPIVSENMDALVQTLTDVHQAAAASIPPSDATTSRLPARILRSVKDTVRAKAKEDKEEIQRLQEMITNMFAKFQLESHMRLEISTQNIADMVVDIRQEQEAQRKRIAEVQEAQAAAARDADNALLNQLNPVHVALHDSDTLEVTTCLEETRVTLLAELDEWRVSPGSPPFFWLNGLAGTGKSTIARTFCQRIGSNGAAPVILASFFVSRQSADRRSAVNIVHTIVYQLALRSEGIRLALCRAMRDQADLLQRPLREQVSKLVSVPLGTLQAADSLVVVIDALDECDKDAKGREGGELIPLLCAAFYSATSSVKLLITSRLEPTIQTTFEEVKQATSAQVVLKLHDIDRDVVQGDIRRYLVHSLRRVATHVPGLQDSDWPSDAIIELLVERAGVLFIWAATVVRFVDIDPFQNPCRRLDQVLSAAKNPSSSPYWKLDELYLQVLSQAVDVGDAPRQDADALVQCLRTVAGTVILLQRQLPPDALASLTGLDSLEARSMLKRLSSVLIVSDDEPVRALHPSFADFLTDSARCSDSRFLILEPVHHEAIAVRCLSVLNEHLRRDICSLGNSHMLAGRPNPDTGERIARCIKPELGYSCCYWFEHLGKCVETSTVLVELETFARTHILHWLECMSLLAEMEAAVTGVSRALHWCQAHLQMADTPHNSVISLLKDAQSLLGEYYEPIRIAPGSLYHSALLFMPRCDLYMATHEDAQDIRLLSPRKSAWTSDILIFQREYSGDTRPIVVSPDDTLIAAVEGHAGALVRVWKTSTGRVLNTWSDLSFNGDFINLSRILAITFSLDGRELAIITLYTVHWWDPYTDVQRTQPMDLQLPSRLRERTDGNCVTARIPSQSVISEGGACVVVGFSDPVDLGSLQTVDLNTSKALVLLHDVAVLSVAISHDASRIASSLDDGRMRIWNAHNGDLLSAMDGSFDSPTVALAFTYRHSIVSMTVDGAVFLLDASGSDTPLRLRTPPVQLQAPEQFCASVLLDSYNASAISASVRSPLLAVATTESVSIWSEETRMLVARRRLYTSLGGGCALGSAVAFMSSRIELVVAPTQEPMSLWDFQDRQAANHGPPFDLLGGAVNSVSFSHDGCYVISGSDDPDLRIWETTSGALKASVQTGHTHPVTAAAFALPDRSLVLSGSDDGQVMHMELCEAESGRLLKHLDSSPHWQTSNQLIAFSGDGSQFVTITRYMSMSPTVLRLYQFSTGKVLAEEREIHHAKFTAISFLPDGSRIIAVCGSSLMSWSTEPPLRDPRTMTAGVAAHWQSQDALFSFACSPDSARIVSTSPCSVIHLWDARTDKKIRSATFALLGDEKSAPLYGWKLQHVLQYSPTTPGRFLSCSWAGVVRIWNDETLAIERTITATELALVTRDDISLSYSTITACYAPDGTKIAVAVEFDLNGECSNSRRLELRVHDVNAGHTVQMLAPIISYPAHEDPGVPNPPSVPLNMSLSFSRENIFFLRPGQPRVEVWSVLSKEHIGSLPSPLRTELTAFAMCSITGRLIVACNPKSIRHQVTETATVSSELVARSGLAEYDATVMCTSIMQDLFDANQTYLCVWDTLSLQLRSTLRIGHDGYQPPHHCIDQASRSISGKLSLQRDIVPAAAWIPRLQRPRFILSPDGWLMFILSPDSWLPRYYRVDDFGGEDHGIFFPLCNIPPNRRPPDGALLDSYHCPWGPVAAHGHIVAIGSLKGPVTIIDLTSLMLKIEKEGKLGAARV